MSAAPERPRLLLISEQRMRAALAPLRSALAANWDVSEATTFERVRFLRQMDRHDVLLLDAGFCDQERLPLSVIASSEPVVVLADERPAIARELIEQGAKYCAPRALALAHPPLLEMMLRQAIELGDVHRSLRTATDELRDARRQVSRLVGMLWEAMPVEGRGSWFSQRHMMERLHEEVARTHRHGGPLTVALGEVVNGPESRIEDGSSLIDWMNERIMREKRRSDVMGQYGPHGFMLLLPRATDHEAVGLCRRLQRVLEQGPALLARCPVYFGVASYSSATPTAASLLRQAEERLERARSNFADRIAF
jgi:diguanylate cyclase (GGDEF)-like protein